MHSTRGSPFIFTNELTRCLNILENIKNSMPLSQEVIKHIRRNRESVPTAMKILTSEETLKRYKKQKLLQMIIAIWGAFPDMANPQKVTAYLSTIQDNRFVRIVLLQILLALLKQGRATPVSAFEAVKHHLFNGCNETNYLSLSILIEVAGQPDLIEPIRQAILSSQPREIPDSLCPKFMHLSLIANIPYKIPFSAISQSNMSLYNRTLDMISTLGTHYPTQMLFSIFPEGDSNTLNGYLGNFLQKISVQRDYSLQHTKKIPFANSYVLQRVKDILAQSKEPEEIVQEIRMVLDTHTAI